MKILSPQQIQRLQNMLAAAQQARRSGMNGQAEGLYRDILKQAPEAWDVQHQLAILLASTGRAVEAAKHFRLIVKSNPTYAPGHANLANALAESGKLDEAITEFNRALSLDSSMPGARIAMGETLRRAARYDDAIGCFTSVLDQDKVNHAAFNALGLVYRDKEDLPRALECFEHAVGLAPKIPEYRMNFAVALKNYELEGLAVEQFYEAAQLNPESMEAFVLLAELLQKQRRFDEAKECYERTLQLKPDNPELQERLGYVYLDLSDTDHSLQMFSSVLNKHPERFMSLLGLGRGHLDAGHSADSAIAFSTLIERYPENHTGYFYLAISRKFKLDDPLIPKLEKLVAGMDKDANAYCALNFALGKIHDDCKQWDKAFDYYRKGNHLRNEQYEYQPESHESRCDALISTFTKEFMEEHRCLGVNSEQPVLIVGMPRSGTTLTEQIISSHPQAIGAGEVLFWGHSNKAVPYTLGTEQPYPQCMSLMKSEHAAEIANKYLALLRKIAGPGVSPARITDKMPHNFMNLGLIALLFPKVQIIHCKRNAMDNCLSIFFQNFGGNHPYAYDLANIGHHHTQYERMMAHWHKVLPGRIMDINYEDTIADPEYWSRQLIEHVGLEWDDACLAPHKQERTVKTASHWQVRQPIYKTSVARWKNYEQHLSPLKEALGYTG